MDFSATQVYEDEDYLRTDSHMSEEDESVQVGMLSINSTDYPIKIGITKIGRLDTCNIVIQNETVSKLHAEIEASGRGSTWICDLKSLNKTKLNNLVLKSNRSYELKDRSVIEFGGVCATYHTYCPANDLVIPETPAPSRQKTTNIIIPNTPDSSLNNSSGMDNDGSIILGTQKDDENSIFRRPRVLRQNLSPSINKKNTSKNESNDSLSAITLHTSNINVSENQVNIDDTETQKFDEECKPTSNSIYDMETQGDIFKPIETNTKITKQLPKLNVCDKTAGRSVTDIHDMETQNYINDINGMEIQENNVIAEKFTTDIHTMKTQIYADNIDEDDKDAQKSEIDNNQEKSLAKIECNIHDLETQKYDENYIAKDISDLETQLELHSVATGEQNKDISNMETQFEVDSMANVISNDRANKEKDRNNIANTTKDEINHENITKSPRSKSSNPRSLNISSPKVKDSPPSSLNQSVHLLESSDLLEFFSEGIDKQKIQVSNASTPKQLTKVSSKKYSDVEDVQNTNNEENNDEDIFEAPTQRINCKFDALMSDDSEIDEEDWITICKNSKKKHRKPHSEQTNDDSESTAEENIAKLAEKKCNLRTLNKASDEVINSNDPGTSIESEDMFDVPTQLNNPMTKNTSNSLIDQSQNSKINEAKISNILSTQIINNQKNIPMPDINDVAPTQLILSRETSPNNSMNLALKNNQNDVNDVANKRINTKSVGNLDREDIDYELAPTQVIGEIENEGKGISTCAKGSSQINDTLEEKLNEMFDDVNNDTNSIHESPHMSTQYLEEILESSQNDDSTKKVNVDDRDACNVSQKQTEKKKHASCNQHSHNLLDSEINTSNVNKAETESQNSDIYFSTITSRRKKNILRDTQEFADSVEDITPDQDIDFPQTSKVNNEKAMLDNVAQESNKRKKRIAKTKHESDLVTETINDNDKNKIISDRNNKRSIQSSKLMKRDDELAETRKQILKSDPIELKVDDTKENTSICIPCPSGNGQRAQILDTLYESDDDILMRLPAVRISGTLSNPASPSASSSSTVRSTKSKRNTARGKKKENTSFKEKSLRKQNIKNCEKHNKLSIDSSNLNNLTGKISDFVDTSDDSNESTYERFQQIADRLYNNEYSCPKRQKKRSKESSRVSPDVSEDPKQSMDVKLKNSATTSSRITRHSSKKNDEGPHNQKETLKNIVSGATESTQSETKSIIGKRKVSLNVIEKSVEQTTSKKRKTVTEECPVSTRSRRNAMKIATNRQSPNILEHFTKTRLRENISKNMKSFEDNKAISKTTLEETQEIFLTDGNVYPEKVNVKRTRQTRQIIYDNQVMTHGNDVTPSENSKKNKPSPTKGVEAQTNKPQKILKVILSPLKSFSDDASQEVESIMTRGSSNIQDKNLSIREGSKAKIFKRKLRTRSKKQQNSDTETDSVLTESSVSSEIEDSDNTQLDNVVLKTKREKSAKSFVSSLLKTQISIKKTEMFKKPRITRNSTSSLLDISAENTTDENSQGSIESNASISSRSSRSRTTRKKMESNQNTHKLIDKTASTLHTNTETTSLILTPSRTRRSTSSLNNSISSAMKHNVLFTGIMEDYSEIVNTLGGSKVEDPAECTILVTDKVRRTYKFLCALAKGIPIVTIDWLRESETAKRFLNWENYILKDPAAETKFGFRLRKSLNRAKEKKMLDGYIVVLTPNVEPPPIKELKVIVSSCGGKALLRPPTKWPEKAVVLSREEDLRNAKKFLVKAPKTVTVQSTEFILTGILRQEIDFVKYKLTG
ncbi:PREDICTED: extracellular matrix-binding protein ebh [Cyphomyrmex costatus]|uniref:extracellular matrix-binding protein ebh n=1 Tax=Cyphomyrmex costatus TaxID=456900 RepID=UPI0008522AA8|nr:PREDICTED: extracellular matrix-binding protein ebh [Cyphomyrmex costatus]